MKIYYIINDFGKTGFETLSEPYGVPGREQVLVRNVSTGVVTETPLSDIVEREVFTERGYETFKKILNS